MVITVPICGNNGKSHFPLLPQIGTVTPAILEIYEPFQIPIVENRCKTNMATYVNSAGIRPPPYNMLKIYWNQSAAGISLISHVSHVMIKGVTKKNCPSKKLFWLWILRRPWVWNVARNEVLLPKFFFAKSQRCRPKNGFKSKFNIYILWKLREIANFDGENSIAQLRKIGILAKTYAWKNGA